jgi:kynurenine formamidase
MTRAATRDGYSLDDVKANMLKLSNWGRWGVQDELGTLNLITPQKRREAAALVSDGAAISCARVLMFAPKVPPEEAKLAPVHFMQRSGDSARAGVASAFDWVGIPLHGLHITHLDSHSHMFWDGQMYNGRSSDAVATDRGALRGGVDIAKDGIFTRGVLLDIPGAQGREFLDLTSAITDADLRAAEEFCGLHVQPGDAVLVRTGYGAVRRRMGASSYQPGLAPDCLAWISERSPAVLGTDTGTDCVSESLKGVEVTEPIHAVCIVAMGMWIVDSCDLEDLALACTTRRRWEFLFSMAPVRLKNATGSPVNPIVVL